MIAIPTRFPSKLPWIWMKSQHAYLAHHILRLRSFQYYAQLIGELTKFIAINIHLRVKNPFVPYEIYAYSDASWADIVPQRKHSFSYLIFCNNAVFSWKSSLSSILAMSSAEAELIALCAFAADVAYCRKLANELGFLQLHPTIIHEDNLGAKQIAESGNFKRRSKHFELRWRFLHHYIKRGRVPDAALPSACGFSAV